MDDCLKEYDAIVAPASGDIAPLIDEKKDQDQLSDDYLIAENYMAMGNFSGYPSMTVPMGFYDGCPLGMNITGHGKKRRCSTSARPWKKSQVIKTCMRRVK